MRDDGGQTRLLGGCWHIRLLGEFDVRNGDVSLDGLPGRAAQLLLVRLALAAGRPQRKEALIDWLWPLAAPANGRHNLRTVKAQLKTLLEPPGTLPGSVLTGDRNTLMLRSSAVDCDAVRFVEHARRNEVAAALVLYAGELVPTLQDDFIDAERAHFQALHERMLRPAATRPVNRGATVARYAPHRSSVPTQRLLPDDGQRFVGRAFEMQRLHEAAASGQRLVVVTGLGGCGKTRLCVEAARKVSGFRIAALVRLDTCTDVGDIIERVRALRELQAGARSTVDQIVADLEGRRVLLILDNLEQFDPAAAAAFVADLLDRLPMLHLWISSRTMLPVCASIEITLQPLPVPALGDGPAAALRTAGAELFQARARLARSDFKLHHGNVASVVALCRRLDGLPLAIELAAARIRSFSAAELLAAIDADWSAIARVGASARSAGRHASMKRLIGWSLKLLGPASRALLQALIVFDAGCTLPQAAAVAQLGMADCRSSLDELVAASLLLLPERNSDAPRWQMLRSVRDVVAKTVADGVRHRALGHLCQHFLATAGQGAVPKDEPHLSAVLQHALDMGNLSGAAALAMAWHGHWSRAGIAPTAARALQRLATAAAAPQVEPGLLPTVERCRLLADLAPLLLQCGSAEEARRAAMAALWLARDDVVPRARALVAWVNCAGRSAAAPERFLPQAHEALSLAAATGDPLLHARALLEVGRCTLQETGDVAGAEALFAAAERLLRDTGDEADQLLALPGRLVCLLELRRFEEVIAPAVRGLERATRLGHVEMQMLLFNRHGVALEGLRRWRQAVEVDRQQARTAMQHGMAYHFAHAAWNQCVLLLRLRQWAAASRLQAFSVRYWTERFRPLTPDEETEVATLRETARRHLGAAREEAAWAEGWALPVGDGVVLAGGSY